MIIKVFEIEAMLSICLYERFLTFVISFGCDTLITKLYFVLTQLCGVFSENV